MRKRIMYLIPILLLLISCSKKQKQIAEYHAKTDLKLDIEKNGFKNQKVVADTITNWQFYKDKELLFKSNITDSNQFTVEIKKSDKYENLILNFFCDFNNKVVKREIKLVLNNKVFSTFVDENNLQSPFPIAKYILDRIRMVKPNEEMKIVYFNPVFKDGITIGILKLTNE